MNQLFKSITVTITIITTAIIQRKKQEKMRKQNRNIYDNHEVRKPFDWMKQKQKQQTKM